ncbi:MAG: type II toxin-antitoxin system ParD family antitoxin [Gaiellaceae bacterium]
MALLLAALLAVACVAFVARPFLAEPETGDDSLGQASPAERERLRLLEDRDRALAALKELEFDHRTGKVSDADYEELVGPLRRQAAVALQGLEPARSVEAEAEAGDKVDARA